MASGDISTDMDDFIPEEDKIPAIVIAPPGGSFSELIEKLLEDPNTQVVRRSTSLEAVSLVSRINYCLILFHASENQDISKYLNMLKLLRDDILSERVRVVMTTYVDDVTLLSQLSFHGCTEIIREPVPAKSLMFKLQRHLKVLKQMSQGPAESGGQEKKKKEKRPVSAQEAAIVDKPVVRFVDPLNFESDFWCLPEAPPKKVGGKWIVKIGGPAPPIGDWVWRDKESDWAWKPMDLENHPYISESGLWTFQGQKPEFKKGTWWFVDAQPQLTYSEENRPLGSKVSVDGSGALILTFDSPAAEMASYKTLPSSEGEEEKESEKAPAVAVNWDPIYRMEGPLTIENDIWLFKNRMPRWVGGRWLAKLSGPGETTGEWIEIKTEVSREKRWKWKWKEATAQDELGVWECTGSRPRFERDGWLFAAQKPELAWYCEGKRYAAKIYSEEGNSIVLAKDSQIALKSLKSSKEDIEKEKAAKESQEKELSELRIDAEHFGSPPGRWEYVSRHLGASKCYVYIPFEIVNELMDSPDIQTLPKYFQYLGTTEPTLSISDTKKEWIFQKNEPETISKFAGLNKLTREFLRSHYGSEMGSKADTEQARENAESNGVKDSLDLDISKPRLNPLMLGLFVSEMMYRPNAEKKQLAQSFCRYVSNSLNGIRTELWAFDKDQWVCANTSDGEPEQFLSSMVGVDFFPKLTDQNTLVSPVLVRKGEEDEIIGALVFGGAEAAGLSIDIAQAFSVMAKGLVRAFKS